MALQTECEQCGDVVSVNEVIYIDSFDPPVRMCHNCVNAELNSLYDKIKQLKEKVKKAFEILIQ